MPNTTYLSPMRMTGCCTWTWSPRMRSTSGDASSFFAWVICSGVGVDWYSAPQCSERTTNFAPAARARCASARIRGTEMRSTAHGADRGTGSPLVPKVYDRWAILSPPIVCVSIRAPSALLRAVPAWATWFASRASSVLVTPVTPLSIEWFEAVEQPSYPAQATASASSWGVLKTGYPLMFVSSAESGVSMWQRARSAPAISARTLVSIGVKSYRLPWPYCSAAFATGPWMSRSPVATRVKPGAAALPDGAGVPPGWDPDGAGALLDTAAAGAVTAGPAEAPEQPATVRTAATAPSAAAARLVLVTGPACLSAGTPSSPPRPSRHAGPVRPCEPDRRRRGGTVASQPSVPRRGIHSPRRQLSTPAPSDPLPGGEEPIRAPEDPDDARLQVLRVRHHPSARAGHHLRGGAQRVGQVERGRRPQLGDGGAGGQEPARRQDGGRHLRRHLRPPPAGPGRGEPDHRQHRRRAADRLRRGDDQPHDVPLRRLRLRDQRQLVPAARHPGAAVRLGHRPRDARDRRAGPAGRGAARLPGGAAGLHRGGGGRPQTPPAQGEGAPQARRDAGQPHAADRPHRRDPPPAQAAGPAGRGGPPGAGGAGRPARRQGAAARRRPAAAREHPRAGGRRRGGAAGAPHGGRGAARTGAAPAGRARAGGRRRVAAARPRAGDVVPAVEPARAGAGDGVARRRPPAAAGRHGRARARAGRPVEPGPRGARGAGARGARAGGGPRRGGRRGARASRGRRRRAARGRAGGGPGGAAGQRSP